MTSSYYFIVQYGDAWVIKNGNRTFGSFSDHVRARDTAIDLADKDSKIDRQAKVLVQEDGGRTLQAVLTYGRDSMPGNPPNSRAYGTYRLP